MIRSVCCTCGKNFECNANIKCSQAVESGMMKRIPCCYCRECAIKKNMNFPLQRKECYERGYFKKLKMKEERVKVVYT